MKSDRFYWCTGCGRWHDPVNRKSNIHYAMYCPPEAPNAGNFDGTEDELRRFLVARELRRAADDEFERKITARIGEREI